MLCCTGRCAAVVAPRPGCRKPLKKPQPFARCRVMAERTIAPYPRPGPKPRDIAAHSEPDAADAAADHIDEAADWEEDLLRVPDLRHFLEPRLSPFAPGNNLGGGFVGDKDKVRMESVIYESPESSGASCGGGIVNTEDGTCIPLPKFMVRSGPRKTIYYEPKKVVAAVVTCGGLCPGLNDVIQNIVAMLIDYGVPDDQIYGIRYGLRGFYDKTCKPIHLNLQYVDGIHLQGGTILGTSRGGADISEIVRRMALWGVNQLYVIGGNGGNAAANAIQQECDKQGVLCSVAAVPKSIDNDILLIDHCFGFDTAVGEAQRALMAGKTEASSAHNGIVVVKLMGRSSGFIAMDASMASGVVDVCLIPEISFTMDRLIKHVQSILERKGHCVVCIAEGTGQDLIHDTVVATDASGNPILADIGTFMRDMFKEKIKSSKDIRLIDPTYMIRAVPTTTTDRIFCKILGQGAVHGIFAGYTGFTVGLVNTHYVLLPIPVVVQVRVVGPELFQLDRFTSVHHKSVRTVDPKGRAWNRLRVALQQPDLV